MDPSHAEVKIKHSQLRIHFGKTETGLKYPKLLIFCPGNSRNRLAKN